MQLFREALAAIHPFNREPVSLPTLGGPFMIDREPAQGQEWGRLFDKSRTLLHSAAQNSTGMSGTDFHQFSVDLFYLIGGHERGGPYWHTGYSDPVYVSQLGAEVTIRPSLAPRFQTASFELKPSFPLFSVNKAAQGLITQELDFGVSHVYPPSTENTLRDVTVTSTLRVSPQKIPYPTFIDGQRKLYISDNTTKVSEKYPPSALTELCKQILDVCGLYQQAARYSVLPSLERLRTRFSTTRPASLDPGSLTVGDLEDILDVYRHVAYWLDPQEPVDSPSLWELHKKITNADTNAAVDLNSFELAEGGKGIELTHYPGGVSIRTVMSQPTHFEVYLSNHSNADLGTSLNVVFEATGLPLRTSIP